MTAKAALCKHLLAGKVLNIKNCFDLIGITNAPREISRAVEKPFGVIVTRIPRNGKSRYGQPCTWFDYKLERNEHNLSGITKMAEYIAAQGGLLQSGAKTEKEAKIAQNAEIKEPLKIEPKKPKSIEQRLF